MLSSLDRLKRASFQAAPDDALILFRLNRLFDHEEQEIGIKIKIRMVP